MPEKQENRSRNDTSPAQAVGREAVARRRTAPGLHKRVLSAAHSLARGVRSSKSASRVTGNKSAPDQPTTSAPARKSRTQVGALDPRAFSYTRTQHAPSAAKPLKLATTSPVVEELDYHHALPFDTTPFPEIFNDAGDNNNNNNNNNKDHAPPALPHLLAEAKAADEEEPQSHQHIEEDEKLPTNSSGKKKENCSMHDVDIEMLLEQDLREASPDQYYFVLKANLRKLALRCNNIPEDQVKTDEDWKNVARLLTDKLLGDWNPHLLPPDTTTTTPAAPAPAAAVAPQPVVEQPDAYVDSYMDFLASDTTRNEGQYGGSDGSSPLLSLNSADFDLSGDF